MPMGAPTNANGNYASRIWKEGTIIAGNPLRYIAPVPEVVFGGIWEQNPNQANDEISFTNIELQQGNYAFLWLVAQSNVASTDVDVDINNLVFINGLNLNNATIQMMEVEISIPVFSLSSDITFTNNSGGFVSGIYFSLKRIP